MSTHLSAGAAAERLGVNRATLYAYVSRGLIRSEPAATGHSRRYRADDIEGLLKKKAARQDPSRVAAEALQWGAPVLESGLTLIQDGRLYYRGLDAVSLARSSSLEAVAGLLWGGALAAPAAGPAPGRVRVPPGLATIARAQAALAQAAQIDPAAYDLRPEGVRRAGLRILRLLTGLAVNRAPNTEPVAERLRRAWRQPVRFRGLLSEALVLAADHELNVSAFTVRCVASSEATPYAAISAGLSAVQGRRHGGGIEQAERLLDLCAAQGIGRGVRGWLVQEASLPGFDHRLYPEGDPRATALFATLAAQAPTRRGFRLGLSVARYVWRHLQIRPTIDLALAVLARALDLPKGSGLMLFALGRTVGWIGHALEAYAEGELIRPRARYIGPLPVDPA